MLKSMPNDVQVLPSWNRKFYTSFEMEWAVRGSKGKKITIVCLLDLPSLNCCGSLMHVVLPCRFESALRLLINFIL